MTASGTADAQSAQNKAAAQQVAAQSAQSFYNYLASRGVNLQQLLASDSRGADFWTNEYAKAKAAGDKRDFQTWVVAALQAAPTDPIWNSIANPAGTAGAANTTLPAWAVDANGNPLQPSVLNQIVQQSSGANNPSTAPIGTLATVQNIAALFAANPSIKAEVVAALGADETRSPEQWLADHITQTEQGTGTFSTLLRNFSVAQATGGNPVVVGTPGPGGGVTPASPGAPAATLPGSAGVGSNLTLDPAITNLIPSATKTASNIFDGTFLNEINSALKPVADARNAGVAAIAAKTAEQRALSGDLLGTELGGISNVYDARKTGAAGVYDASTTAAQGVYDANVAKLADLLGVRKEAAQQIYDASLAGAGGVRDASIGAAGGVRDARTTGATNIYGAESLQADTYAQAAQQSLSRLLAQQGAERARQGFTGGSSGSDIVGARLMADYTQRGSGARAQAGVNYQNRLSDAGVGYATDTGNANVGYANAAGQAGVARATTIGQSNEADAAAKLNAAVQLAQQLGLAGTTRAGTLASAGEQDAIAQLQAKVADATRRLTYLTSDADIAQANADLANANDQLNALVSNQNRMTSSIGTPFQLASSDLALKGQLSDQQYQDIDALLKRLNSFTTTPASGPVLTTSTPGSVLNGSQIAGGALTALGSSVGNTASNQSLTDLIKNLSDTLSKGGSSGAGVATVPTGGLMSSPSYLGNTSVFSAPKPGG